MGVSTTADVVITVEVDTLIVALVDKVEGKDDEEINEVLLENDVSADVTELPVEFGVVAVVEELVTAVVKLAGELVDVTVELSEDSDIVDKTVNKDDELESGMVVIVVEKLADDEARE
jgi:hypothetical protein